ncbi:MAG TPA: FAD-dependent oxidoreductase [Candidatus Acidoferrum sp.]|nr:FAD-dependent oxidoreductase [Candidatus Acidoferrum sp.]
MTHRPYHFVAIVGGAIAGSVAAEILADNRIHVVVIEQNKKPYGKIEDGLPRWHLEQRKQEYSRIDSRLRKPGVFFLPCTRLGRDLDFQDLCDNWGFSAVVLANGAWRDRKLGIPGAEEFVDKGLVYQNPFIYWYNHKNEDDYTGPHYQAPDEALVVGGGLASIDVVKILQLENYERVLRARGIPTDVYELEKKGVPAVCKMHGIAPEDLGVKGCLLIYRRRGQDMPLAQPPENATSDQIAKTEATRQKMLRLAQGKYLFRFQDRRVSTGLVLEEGRLVGLKVAETKVEGRNAEPVAGSEYQLRAPMVISSIGSVPEKIPGITMKCEYYDFIQEALPRYGESDHVFGVGNVVTGQGNIRSSLLHSEEVTTKLIENYIGVGDEGTASARFYAGAEARGTAQAQDVRDRVQVMRGLSYHEIAALEQRIRAFQERVGYTDDYDSWIAGATPALTEGQVNFLTDIPQESTPESSTAFCCAACR